MPVMPKRYAARIKKLQSPKGAEISTSLGKPLSGVKVSAVVLPEGFIELSWDNSQPEDQIQSSTNLVDWVVVQGAGNPAILPATKSLEMFRIKRPK